MKKIASMLLILVIILSNSFYANSNMYAKVNKEKDNKERISIIVRQENQSITSEIALIKIFLKNGSVLNYTTLDDAVRDFYEGIVSNRISASDILNVSLIYFRDYLAMLQNNMSLNQLEYVPGYRFFFSILVNSGKYNYSGSIIAVNGQEFLYNTYGDKLTKCFMYGRLNNLKIIDVRGEEVLVKDSDLVILSYINTNNSILSEKVIRELNETLSINPNIKIIVIDIANKLNESSEYVKNYRNLYFSNDFNTSIETNTTGSFNSFGFVVTPSYVYIKGSLYVVRKAMGYEQADLITQYVSVLSKGDRGLFSYIINNVIASNLIEGEKADISIRIDDGFSNVTLHINYAILNKNNETLDTGEINKPIQKSGWVNFRVNLPNTSYILILSIATYSDVLPGSSIKTSFIIKEREEEKHRQEFPWDLITGIFLLLVFIIMVGSYAYNYTMKKRYKRVRRKKKVKK